LTLVLMGCQACGVRRAAGLLGSPDRRRKNGLFGEGRGTRGPGDLLEATLWHADLDGSPPSARPLTILVEDASRLLADARPRDLAILLGALSGAATVADGDEDAGVYRGGFRLWLLLHDTPDQLRVLARRIQAAGFLPSDTGQQGATPPSP
jgi:hypothetical protein